MHAFRNGAIAIVFATLLLGAGRQADAAGLTATQQLWQDSFSAEQDRDYVRAVQHMQKIIRSGGDYYYANLRVGWLLYLGENYSEAISYYRKAASLEPGAITAMTGLINGYSAVGDTENAIKTSKAALIIDPMNYGINMRLAGFYYDAKDFSHASAYFRKLTGLYPEDLTAANGLAWSYLNQGMTRDAQIIFLNILVISPTHDSAIKGLALCAESVNPKINN